MTKLHSLNRNELKYLVIIAMLIDHIAWAFVPTASLLGQIMHIIGRLTGPTMAYMLADGYYYTRSVEKYACRLGIFALLSWIPFSYFELGYIGLQFGVIYTLLLSLLAIWLWDKGRCPQPVKVFGILYADAVLLRKYAGNDTLVAGILSSRNFSGVSTHSVWIQRKERQQETVSQVVFLCVLSAAPVNFRCIAVGGVCINGTRYRK